MRKTLLLVALLAVMPALLRASTPGAGVETWKYDAETKVLSLKIVNTSGKDITAYSMSITLKFADGTTDALPDGSPSHERSSDELGSIIWAQMGNAALPQGSGHGFEAGTARYDVLPQLKDVVDVKAVVNAIIYSDCTAEVQPGGEHGFKTFMASRRGGLQALQQISEIVKKALDDPTITNPSAAAKAELTKVVLDMAAAKHTPDDPESFSKVGLENAISILGNMTERGRLQKYLEDTDKQIELMLPHTQIALNK